MKRAILLAVVGLSLLGSTPALALVSLVDTRPRIAPVPEPTAALVFGTSLLVIGLSKRRRGDR